MYNGYHPHNSTNELKQNSPLIRQVQCNVYPPCNSTYSSFNLPFLFALGPLNKNVSTGSRCPHCRHGALARLLLFTPLVAPINTQVFFSFLPGILIVGNVGGKNASYKHHQNYFLCNQHLHSKDQWKKEKITH